MPTPYLGVYATTYGPYPAAGTPTVTPGPVLGSDSLTFTSADSTMTNTLTLTATRANTRLPVEFYHPVTKQWVGGTRQGTTDAYQVVLTGVPAGDYGAGTATPLRCRLQGSSPEVGATFAQTVTVVGASTPAGPPTVSSLAPTHGAPGSSVTLTGTNLTGATNVRLNGALCPVVANNATTLTVKVPTGATTGTFTFTVGSTAYTTSQLFTVDAATQPGKPALLVTLGNSQTFGYLAQGGVSATTPAGYSNGSWPDQLLANVASGTLEVHNEGVSGQQWGELQNRVASIAQYFTSTSAATYSQRIVTIQEATNAAWHGGQNGLASARSAVSLVKALRAALPADVQLWLFTGYPFGDPTVSNAQDLDAYISQFNDILLQNDQVNAGTIHLYEQVDKVLNIRTAPAFADYNATIDRDIFGDGVHATTRGNSVPAYLVQDALTSSAKVVNSTYQFPAPDPNAPYGTLYDVPNEEISFYGASPQGSGGFRYYEGDNGNASGFKVLFNKGIEFINSTQFRGLCEAFVNGQSQGTFQMNGVVGEVGFEVHVGGGANVLTVTPRGPAGSNGYCIATADSFKRWA